MNILIIFLLVIGILIAVLLIAAAFTRKEYRIKREIVINVPLQTTFDYVKHLKNQDHFNKWVMVDPAMQREFKGADGTVGFIYA